MARAQIRRATRPITLYSASMPLLKKNDRDRKSTRLNSSHSQISYAVFCLKKKKADVCAHEGRPPQYDEIDGRDLECTLLVQRDHYRKSRAAMRPARAAVRDDSCV